VIHTGKEAKSNVGVIIEAKSPSNKAEMPTQKPQQQSLARIGALLFA